MYNIKYTLSKFRMLEKSYSLSGVKWGEMYSSSTKLPDALLYVWRHKAKKPIGKGCLKAAVLLLF